MYAWCAARSVARGLPAPELDHGGWRVDTNLEQETCRWVFDRVCDGLRVLGGKVSLPRHFIKLYGTADELLAALPSHWQLASVGYVMTPDEKKRQAKALPAGYDLRCGVEGVVSVVEIIAPDGSIAASGYASEMAGVFVYDRIVTAPDHGRRGLGSIVMDTLGEQRKSADSIEVLIATDEGCALYSALGWRVLSPFSTAVIPD